MESEGRNVNARCRVPSRGWGDRWNWRPEGSDRETARGQGFLRLRVGGFAMWSLWNRRPPRRFRVEVHEVKARGADAR